MLIDVLMIEYKPGIPLFLFFSMTGFMVYDMDDISTMLALAYPSAP